MRLFHRKQKKNPAGTIVPKIVLTDQPDYQKARKYWNKLKQRLAGEIVLYQPDEKESLEVRVDADTVWLTQQQMGQLFGTNRQAINL